jgi:putative transposase
LGIEEKRERIDVAHARIPIIRQCDLLGLPRSSFYYKPAEASEWELEFMRRIDEQYMKTPFYGIRRMTECLNRQGCAVNHKRIARLMRVMGIEAVYPKPRLSQRDDSHRIYPYLLKGVEIVRPDHVWSTDITYIRMQRGFLYLVAVMDWFSRYVLSWEVSNTMDVHFCMSALERALARSKPRIFNTDQGSQFTSSQFTGLLQQEGVTISMDGRGRAFDNIFIERLWRSVKYEEVYLHDYEGAPECIAGLRGYFHLYNESRPHQALGYRTPKEVYFGHND